MINTLIILALLHNAKVEMLSRYPAYAKQIMQVGVPTVGYRNHIWFDWSLKGFLLGKCDLFGKPQIKVVRDGDANVTIRRLLHELRHFVRVAAGIPVKEDKQIDWHSASRGPPDFRFAFVAKLQYNATL